MIKYKPIPTGFSVTVLLKDVPLNEEFSFGGDVITKTAEDKDTALVQCKESKSKFAMSLNTQVRIQNKASKFPFRSIPVGAVFTVAIFPPAPLFIKTSSTTAYNAHWKESVTIDDFRNYYVVGEISHD